MAKLHALWKEKYPQTCGFIELSLPKVITASPGVWAAFIAASKLDDARARAAVQISESGPSIWFRTLDLIDNGLFRREVPDRIEINTLVACEFEKASAEPKAQKFLEQIILHEMVHWALHPNQPPWEAGEAFEIAAYGAHIPRFWATAPVVPAPITPTTTSSAPEVGNGVPRGIRNNNPGNIKRSSSQWMGLADIVQMSEIQRREETFCVFTEPRWGLRAMAYLLLRYQRDYACKSTWDVIKRWAPQSDNNYTLDYAQFVASRAKVGLYDSISLLDQAISVPFIGAMIKMENNKQPYSDAQLKQAFVDAAQALPAMA
jgi:hypothetical protein